MSAVVERFLICDCCYQNFGVDNRSSTLSQHRSAARKHGWISTRRGKDYCEECTHKKLTSERK